ncbi:uncharacterized protein F5147DRAFT_658751 [Suillus discolor]|uniref:CxC5 like cysteine cluster associated with KDZ domain-containing protein n=1 Tax=Suillus discolor TaxID=1912936 RepID=A0A9P7ESA3_9AGAM|nr:uncharacterized protein F5147DRAFT_658751 [Suillus discolor]KAG2088140.1 hypothetical protein F5147DRAFT_658751 [Suillus discolor]
MAKFFLILATSHEKQRSKSGRGGGVPPLLRTSGMWIFQRKLSIVNATLFCTLYHFMNIAFALKDDILLTLPSTHLWMSHLMPSSGLAMFPTSQTWVIHLSDWVNSVVLLKSIFFHPTACVLDQTVHVWQQQVVLFTLASGPCVAKAAHFYCETCKIDYFHNYSVSRAASDPFDSQDLDTVGTSATLLSLFESAVLQSVFNSSVQLRKNIASDREL